MSGEAQDPVAWLRSVIESDRDLALHATSPGDLSGSGMRLAGDWRTGCACEGDCQDYPSCEEVTGDGIHIYSEGGHDSFQAEHIARHDPQDTIARCEAELAILDEHHYMNPGECATCRDVSGRAFQSFPCRTVRLLLGAYKHRSGYDEKWGEP